MNVDLDGHEWWKFWEWDWAKIGMIALSVVEVIGGIALTVFTSGVGITIGIGLIGTGISSIGSAILNEKNGGSFFAGWASGQVSGVLGMIPGIGTAAGSFLSSVIIDQVDKGKIDRNKALVSAIIGFIFGTVTYVFGMGSSNDLIVKLLMGSNSGLLNLINILINQHMGG